MYFLDRADGPHRFLVISGGLFFENYMNYRPESGIDIAVVRVSVRSCVRLKPQLNR